MRQEERAPLGVRELTSDEIQVKLRIAAIQFVAHHWVA
jgi:hypothetical protein